ncbi:MAG TPA: IclR family transcriptional regulator [Burkholderiaceae bacterium]|nr:IclR family transcriptional regulator [Burkholderiaceae bacterium]
MLVDALQLIALKRSATVREVGEALGLPRSTAHRMVAQLLDIGFVEKHTVAGSYVLGPLIGELAGGNFVHRTLVLNCRPEIEALRDSTGETISLHVLQSGRRVLLDQAESTHELRWVFSNPLVPMPLHAGAAAKMLLALVPAVEAKRIVGRESLARYTERTPQDHDRLLAELAQIRKRGYSDSVGEVTPGIASLAVPVIAQAFGGQPLAVISLTAPVLRLPDSRRKPLLEALQATAKRARQRLEHVVGFGRHAA